MAVPTVELDDRWTAVEQVLAALQRCQVKRFRIAVDSQPVVVVVVEEDKDEQHYQQKVSIAQCRLELGQSVSFESDDFALTILTFFCDCYFWQTNPVFN